MQDRTTMKLLSVARARRIDRDGHRPHFTTLGCALLAIFFVAPVWACSCAPLPLPQLIDRSSTIFLGQVDRVENQGRSNGWGEPRIRVYFAVERRWKGQPGNEIVETWYNQVSCEGFYFETGKRYLVFLDEGRAVFHCGGTRGEGEDGFEKTIRTLDARSSSSR